MKRTLRHIVLFIALPLLSGALVYLLFREPVPLITRLFGIRSMIIDVSCLPGPLASFIRYHLADALFAFALAATLRLFISNGWVACGLAILYMTAYQLLQLLGVINGTADVWDVLWSAVFVGIYKIWEEFACRKKSKRS